MREPSRPISSPNREIVLSISHPRPLAEAARQLEEKLGMAISYEDVAPIYRGDYARPLDTDWGRKIDEEGDHRFRDNRIDIAGGALDIHIPVDAAGNPAMPVSQILWELIDQHKARGNPGQFQLLTVDDSLVIVPVSKRDTNGMLIPEHSPLDAQISFPMARRGGAETFDVISKTVTTASGRTVHFGLGGPKRFAKTAIELGADRETARDVLIRALKGLRYEDGREFAKTWSWQLLCGPERRMQTTPTDADIFCSLNPRFFQ
jgi:hypothetical protein